MRYKYVLPVRLLAIGWLASFERKNTLETGYPTHQQILEFVTHPKVIYLAVQLKKMKYTLFLFFLLNCFQQGFAQDTYRWAFTVDFDRFNDFDNGLAIIQKGRERGFIDTDGNVFIQPKFHIIDAFSENVASAGFTDYKTMDSKSGFIDRSGNFVIDPDYEVTSPMQEGFACVKYRGLWGYIDNNGKWKLFPKFEEANVFHRGYAAVKTKGKWGVINKRGQFIVDNDYDYMLNMSDNLFATKINGLWGFLTIQSQFKIKPTYTSAQSFQEGRAVVEKNRKFGMIDPTGKMVIPAKFDRLFNFSFQLAAAQQNGKWGYIDSNGNWAIQPIYDEAYPFSENLGRVKKDGKYGYITTDGTMTIPNIFNRAYDFHDQLARVYTNQKKGFIRYIPPPPPETEADKPDAAPEEITQRAIKTGRRIKVKNAKITVRIFDYKKIDGDIVSLNFKGSWILKDYTLSKKYHEFTINLERDRSNPDLNYLMLYAMNLGRNPPNTAQLTIIDGQEEKQVVLESDLKTCDIIYFDY